MKKNYQVCEVVSSFASHQSLGVAEPRDEVDIAHQPRWVRLQDLTNHSLECISSTYVHFICVQGFIYLETRL
jgi:hypothetical protein